MLLQPSNENDRKEAPEVRAARQAAAAVRRVKVINKILLTHTNDFLHATLHAGVT